MEQLYLLMVTENTYEKERREKNNSKSYINLRMLS